MSIEIVWDNPEQTVIRYIFGQKWTWDEFYAARDHAYGLIDAGQQRVAVIFDVPAGMTLPGNMLTNGRNAVAKRHANTSLIVIVVPNMYLRTLLEMIIKLAGPKADIVEMVPTLAAARQRAQEHLSVT
jgi:hypothetical protein